MRPLTLPSTQIPPRKKVPNRSSRKILKDTPLGLKQFFATESYLKMMKNVFYVTSKAFFVLKIFQLLS